VRPDGAHLEGLANTPMEEQDKDNAGGSWRHRKDAWLDLWRGYRDDFSFWWSRRKQMDSAVEYRLDEAQFLPAALSLQEAPVSPVGRWVGRILMMLIAVLLVWASVGKIDIVVQAQGKIIPSAYTQSVASVDIAVVKSIRVKEGQFVHQGDVLLELDGTAPESERDKAISLREQALLQKASSLALADAVVTGRSPQLPQQSDLPGVSEEGWEAAQRHLDGQWLDFVAKRKRLESDMARWQSALPLASERARQSAILAASGDISRHEYLEREQARRDLVGQLAEAKSQKIALIQETRRQALDSVQQAHKEIVTQSEDAIRATQRSRLMHIVAPIDGTVHQLAVHTVGGVVKAAEALLQIVPQNEALEVEAVLENKDVGFVQPGQEAGVKVEAFEYTKYGVVPARVSQVSRDAVQDEKRGLLYTVRVALDRHYIAMKDERIPLSPGMAVGVEIKTGSRRVIEYVLSPLIQHGRESLRER
jgi:hemolysin D